MKLTRKAKSETESKPDAEQTFSEPDKAVTVVANPKVFHAEENIVANHPLSHSPVVPASEEALTAWGIGDVAGYFVDGKQAVELELPVTTSLLTPILPLLARNHETGKLAEHLVITVSADDFVQLATRRKADQYTEVVAIADTLEEALAEAVPQLKKLKGYV